MQQLTAVWFLKYFILFQKKKKKEKGNKSQEFKIPCQGGGTG